MTQVVVYEQISTGWSAYAPDLPGLDVGTTTFFEEAAELRREDIVFHTAHTARMPLSSWKS